MYYVWNFVGSLILLLLVLNIWNYYDVLQEKYKIPWITIYTGMKSGKYACLFVGAFASLLGVSGLLIYRNISILNFCRLMLVLFCLLSCAFIDYRRHIIPNKIIAFTFICGVVVLVLEYFFRRNEFMNLLISSLLGLVFFGLLLTVVSIVTKKALGFGDVKLFACIGFILGFAVTYGILIYSLIACVLVAVYLLVVKKKGRKYTIAFAPFVLFGFLFIVFFGGY